VCWCRRLGLFRLFFGVLGPDDPRDEAARRRWRERRRAFRRQVRAAFRDLLAEDDEEAGGTTREADA